MNKLQLILPVYRDQDALKKVLTRLLQQGWCPEQITVVDATETDPFPIKNPWNVEVLHPPATQRGRARQMNYGAEHTQSNALLFLHADSYLPTQAEQLITETLKKGYVGGGFSRRFDSPSRFLKFTCVLADLRGKWTGWFFGDQAIFCSRQAFEQTGGFPDISPFEDLTFCRKLKLMGPLTLLKPGILSSARRFQAEGPLRRTCKDLYLTLAYFSRNPKAASRKD